MLKWAEANWVNIKNNYFQVTAVDQPVNGLNTTAEVNITVTDINDNNPKFLPLPTPIVVAEGKYTPGAPGVVCQIQAEDSDAGKNGRVTISTSSFTEIFNITEVRNLMCPVSFFFFSSESFFSWKQGHVTFQNTCSFGFYQMKIW